MLTLRTTPLLELVHAIERTRAAAEEDQQAGDSPRESQLFAYRALAEYAGG